MMRLFNRFIIKFRRFFHDSNRPPDLLVLGGVVLVRRGRKILFSIQLERLAAFGEATDWPEFWTQDYFLVLEVKSSKGTETIQVSNDCRGWSKAVLRLRETFSVPDNIRGLANCKHPASVYFWPPEKAGQPIWPDYGPTHSVGTQKDFERWIQCRKTEKGPSMRRHDEKSV